jgi:hypothetical protein
LAVPAIKVPLEKQHLNDNVMDESKANHLTDVMNQSQKDLRHKNDEADKVVN